MIRRAERDDIPGLARVHCDTWKATYRGMVPDEYLDGLSVEKSTGFWERVFENESRRGAEFVALEGDRVVGFVCGGPAREIPEVEGEIYAMYLLPESQGSGVGRSMITYIFDWLQTCGYGSLGVWVLRDNPTREFYQHLGGRLVREKTIAIGGSELAEELFVWSEITRIPRDSREPPPV